MEQEVSGSRGAPHGLLRVNATLGFGRSHVAPVISRFVRKYPQVQVQLQLSVNPPPLTDDAYDVCIRFGEPPDARVIARRLADNRRLLCAAPAYLARARHAAGAAGPLRHNCIGIRQGDEAYGLWRLTGTRAGDRKTVAIRTRGTLTHQRRRDRGELGAGRPRHRACAPSGTSRATCAAAGCVQVLPDYATPAADIYAVYPQRHQVSARVRAFVDFIAKSFAAPAAPR